MTTTTLDKAIHQASIIIKAYKGKDETFIRINYKDREGNHALPSRIFLLDYLDKVRPFIKKGSEVKTETRELLEDAASVAKKSQWIIQNNFYSREGYERLANAVVELAAKDYRLYRANQRAGKLVPTDAEKLDRVIRFLSNSQLLQLYTSIDGQRLMEMIDEDIELTDGKPRKTPPRRNKTRDLNKY